MKTIIYLTLFLSISSTLYGQNYLFQPEESGLYVSGDYGRSTRTLVMNGANVSAGYSYKGRLSFSLNGTRRWADGNWFSYNMISSSVGFVIIPQKVLPVALEADLGLGFYKDNEFYKGRWITLGGSIFRRQRLTERLVLVPRIAVTNRRFTSETFDDGSNMSLITAQASFLVNRFTITPGITREASWDGYISAVFANLSVAYTIPIIRGKASLK